MIAHYALQADGRQFYYQNTQFGIRFKQQQGNYLLQRVAGKYSQRRCSASAQKANSTKYFSPSKINVFLRIIRRREDGFHDLASLFHVIDLGDYLTFTPIDGEKDILECDTPGVPTDESNLVIKALDLYRRHTNTSQHFQIQLDKTVPHGAGLGGGSGNAATALFAINELSGRLASNDDLLTWSGEIGSDISVFFSKGAAYCTGRGEIVENVEPPLPLSTNMVLVKPPIGLSTPQIFKALDLSRTNQQDPQHLLRNISQEGLSSSAIGVNDLEQPAFDTLKELSDLKNSLVGNYSEASPPVHVFMTGSGSTMVCMSQAEGDDVALSPPKGLGDELFVCNAKLMVRNGEDVWYEK